MFHSLQFNSYFIDLTVIPRTIVVCQPLCGALIPLYGAVSDYYPSAISGLFDEAQGVRMKLIRRVIFAFMVRSGFSAQPYGSSFYLPVTQQAELES